MKKMFIRSLCLTLALLLLFPACANTGNEEETDAANTAEENGEETNEDTEVFTGLPEYDLEGYEFRILTNGVSAEHCHHSACLAVEDFNGEGVNDAVHQRQLLLEDRYNFSISPQPVQVHDSGWSDAFRQSVSASDKDFEMGICTTSPCATVVLGGYTVPWNELEYVDLSEPWWNQSALQSMSVKGVTYYTTGDMTYETIAFTYCMFFNKELCEDWGITADSLYETVDQGRWTLSQLYKLTKDVYVDVNADGQRDFDDLYGVTMNSLSGQSIFQNSTNTLTTYKDENDVPHIIEDTERLASLIEKMYILMYESTGTFPVTKGYSTRTGSHDWWGMTSYKLLTHSSLFSTGLFYELYHEYTEKDFDIGVLPLPKYDTAQEKYLTMSDYHGPFAVLPKTTDTERTGFCSTAISAYGREIITPAYYETALKTRYADTRRDSEMIELTMQGLIFDMYGVYTTSSILQRIIYDHNYNFASYWAKNQNSIRKQFDKIIKTFDDYID
ncbi:MAG: hypothetical protein IKQ92_11065 [Clostridia bacterium]|nr:hypothetical protein [Clostridia bacterium]